jgi:hypothetical protein
MQFKVRTTIGAENLDQQTKLIEYFHILGVKYVAASPTYHSKVNLGIKTPSLVEFAKHFMPVFYNVRELACFTRHYLPSILTKRLISTAKPVNLVHV